MALVLHKDVVYAGKDPSGQRFFHMIQAGNPHAPVWKQMNHRWANKLRPSVTEMLGALLQNDQLEMPGYLGGELTITLLE